MAIYRHSTMDSLPYNSRNEWHYLVCPHKKINAPTSQLGDAIASIRGNDTGQYCIEGGRQRIKISTRIGFPFILFRRSIARRTQVGSRSNVIGSKFSIDA